MEMPNTKENHVITDIAFIMHASVKYDPFDMKLAYPQNGTLFYTSVNLNEFVVGVGVGVM